MKRNLRGWLWLVFGAAVIGLIAYHLSHSPEWRSFSWRRLWSSLAGARLGLLLLVLVGVYASYLMRAYRWRFFLNPIKRASLWVVFVGQILGFSSIYLIGRLGEFVRPAYIAKKENVPISAMLAVWLLERIFDSLALVLLFAAALYFEPPSPSTARGIWAVRNGWFIMFALTGLLIAGLVLFHLRGEKLTAWALRQFDFLSASALNQFEHFLRSFTEAVRLIQNWRELLGSAVATVLLWALNTTIFWLVFKSLRGGLESLSWLGAAMTLFCAALGLVVQFPGVGGGYQVGVILALTEIFNVAKEPATSAGILVWIVMSFPCLGLGLVLLIHEGLTLRKLEAMVEEERIAKLGKI